MMTRIKGPVDGQRAELPVDEHNRQPLGNLPIGPDSTPNSYPSSLPRPVTSSATGTSSAQPNPELPGAGFPFHLGQGSQGPPGSVNKPGPYTRPPDPVALGSPRDAPHARVLR